MALPICIPFGSANYDWRLMKSDLKTLISKLNAKSRKALEASAAFCVSQTHHSIEMEHLLHQLLEIPDTDLQRLLRYYEVDVDAVRKELDTVMGSFQRGSERTPTMSSNILEWLEEAWLISSLQRNETFIRTGTLLWALVENDELRRTMLESTISLFQIPRDSLRKDIWEILRVSSENESPGVGPKAADQRFAGGTSATSGNAVEVDPQTPGLNRYTIDLTAQAREGRIDPIRGRDSEIRQLIDILTRRRQNNPILTGEAGVGKTAVVEGLALRISQGDVPPGLQNISLRILDLGLLQAGAGIRGEFEERLKSVIEEVKRASQPIILFIDEAHTLIGAGGQSGQNDAANLLKPALARGELRTIAATTWSEYKKYFEKDHALVRRFQVVKVDEPPEAVAIDMLRGLIPTLEQHHQIRILDEAVHDSVRLSQRYIAGRQLPDKAISVLDTACARVAIGQNATPSELETVRHQVDRIDTELRMLQREQRSGLDHQETIQRLTQERETLEKQRFALEQQWQQESLRIRQIKQLHAELSQYEDGLENPEVKQRTRDLASLEKELEAVQGETPMVFPEVDGRVVASVISEWTGIPVGKMLTDEIQTILNLKDHMTKRVIGQTASVDAICRRIRTSRASLDDPGRPIGVFLLVGPSGVGKTETALTLAELLYGGERNLVTINMSEYQEAHTVSSLKGSPPGYVGFGQGGVLTEAVRRNPYCVVLLDEVEKAHPDVIELFYQVFDKGTLEDGEGVPVDFKNTVIFLTSNLGTETIMEQCVSQEALPDAENLTELVRPALLRHFKPALLGRLVVVPYYPLTSSEIQQIVRLKLAKIQRRFFSNHQAHLSYDDALKTTLASRCNDVDSGARTIDHLLTHTLLPELSSELLQRMAEGKPVADVHIEVDSDGNWGYRFPESS